MSKILQRPLACRNAHCGAFCCPADASFWGGNPSRCYNYERRDDLYRDDKLLDKVKKAREEIENLTPWDDCLVETYEVLEILDELIESEGKE